jgi:hypothetical protein
VSALRYQLLGLAVSVRGADDALRPLLAAAYAARRADGPRAALAYAFAPAAGRHRYRMQRAGARPRAARTAGDALRALDADLAVELQRRSPGTFFLHAAVLVRAGRAALLVGASGAGKSTAAWALAHHGFAYAGDELAPIEVARSSVRPCPRALFLKQPPPPPYGLPLRSVATSWGHVVPLRALPGGTWHRTLPVGAVFFVDGRATGPPGVIPLTRSEAAARLYAHALNPLAHAEGGLEPAVRLAERVPAYRLRSADLAAAARAVAEALERPLAQMRGQRIVVGRQLERRAARP